MDPFSGHRHRTDGLDYSILGSRIEALCRVAERALGLIHVDLVFILFSNLLIRAVYPYPSACAGDSIVPVTAKLFRAPLCAAETIQCQPDPYEAKF